MSVIGELAGFVAGAKASALPEAERERLGLHLTDAVIAALAGARIAEGKALHALGERPGLAERIGRRAAAARLTEIDDIHMRSCVTPSAGVVPVALALAVATENFDPGEIASAIWAGTEIAIRIGLAVNGPQILYRGVWPTYLAAPVAAAATASRVLGLNESRTGHALSLAFMLMAGGVGRIHGAPSGRWFLYANAVASGVAAAQAAHADYRGDPALFDRDWLADTHGIALDRDRLKKNPSAPSVYSAVSIKPVCSAKQGIAAIEAFRAILDEGASADAIAKVRVHVPKAYAAMIAARAEPGARQSTLVSIAHQLALAARQPDQLYDIDRSGSDQAAEVAQFAAKVEVVADAALETFYPEHWPAEVEVEAEGKQFRRRVIEAAGDPERPFGRAQIEDKAHRVLDPMVGAARSTEWLTLCKDGLTGSNALMRLATGFAADNGGMN